MDKKKANNKTTKVTKTNKVTTKKVSNMNKKTAIKRKSSKRKKAFTLIELLAVVIIVGILVIVSVPAVTEYISSSRKASYVDTAKTLISGARTVVNSGKLGMYDESVTYYLPYDMIPSENGSRSPYGEFEEAYIVATFDKSNYSYFWTSKDTTKTGIYLTRLDNLKVEGVVSGVKEINTDVAICGKENIIIFDKDGSIKESKVADDCIEPDEVYSPDTECTYKLVADYGSFSENSDVKQVCVKLVTDYTYDYDYVWFQTSTKYNGYSTILNVDLDKKYFTDSSYIRVYNNSNKEVLLAEINKDSYPKYSFDLTSGTDLSNPGLVKSLGVIDDYYIDKSKDLENKGGVYVMYSSSIAKKTYSGPWIKKNSDVKKIENLINSLYNIDMQPVCEDLTTSESTMFFEGFTNCTSGECSGNIYHATYELYCEGLPIIK